MPIRLNHPYPLLIVPRMRRFLLFTALLLLIAAPAAAQSTEFGLQIGGGQGLEDGVDFDLGESLREVYVGTELEPGTILKLKGGQYDGEIFGDNGSLEYITAIVEYRFSETFGSSSVFLGPGFYRSRPDGDAGFEGDEDYGFTGGVNGIFPVSRRFALTAELAYHWAHVPVIDVERATADTTPLEDEYSFIALSGGLRFAF